MTFELRYIKQHLSVILEKVYVVNLDLFYKTELTQRGTSHNLKQKSGIHKILYIMAPSTSEIIVSLQNQSTHISLFPIFILFGQHDHSSS